MQGTGQRSTPPASEACFSYESYLDNLHKRLCVFETLGDETELHHSARTFLREEFAPLLEATEQWYRQTLSDLKFDTSQELAADRKTLSPSDFGFHNALRRADNRLVFVDFEYFGWDDPAKMIADFIHHPALPIPSQLKRYFLDCMLGVFNDDDSLKFRVRLIYPILGLKWCLIMLNEYLPGPLERRRLANASLAVEEVLRAQLQKARNKLNEVHALFDLSTTHSPWKVACETAN